MSRASRDFAKTLVGIAKSLEEQVQRPAVQTGTVTKVQPSGALDITLADGTKLSGVAAISKHVQEVGRQLVIGMNGAEPVIIVADLIAARTILAGMIRANSITTNELTVLLQLLVGQSIESTAFMDGPDGVGFHIGSDRVVFNTDVTIRGLLAQLPGREILPNPGADQDVLGWTASTGALTQETVDTDGSPGAFKHVTPAVAAETYIESGFVPIDRLAPYLSSWRVKPDLGTVQCRVGIRFYDSAGTFINEVTSPTLSGVTVYTTTPDAYAEPPSVVGGNSGVVTYQPNGDAVVTNAQGNVVNSAGNRWQNIDESVVDTSDFVYGDNPSAFGGVGVYEASSNIVAGAMAGRNILSVKLRYWVSRGVGSNIATFQRRMTVGGTLRTGTIEAVGTDYPGYDLVEETFTVNPVTGAAWTPAQVEDFRSGGASSYGANIYNDQAAGIVTAILKMELVVSWITATSGVVPSQAKVRLYSTPPTAVARTIKWDNGSTRPQPAQRGGLVMASNLLLGGVAVPGGTLPGGYAATSTPQAIGAAAETDLTTLTATVTVRPGRRIRVSAVVPNFLAAVNSVIDIYIKEGATYLQAERYGQFNALISVTSPPLEAILTPTAGVHTYKIAMNSNNAGNTCQGSAAGTPVAFILVEDIGV